MKRKTVRMFYYLEVLLTGNVKVFKDYLSNENNLGSDCNTPRMKRALTFLAKTSEKAVFLLADKHPNVRVTNTEKRHVIQECESVMRDLYSYNMIHKIKLTHDSKVMADESLDGVPQVFIDMLMQSCYMVELFYNRYKNTMSKCEDNVFSELLKRTTTIFNIYYDMGIIWEEK